MPYLPIGELAWSAIKPYTYEDARHNFWGLYRALVDLPLVMDVTPTVGKESGCNMDLWLDMTVESVKGRHNYHTELLNLLPWYEQGSQVNQKALRGVATILAQVESVILQMELNSSLSTAVEMLDVWEGEAGLSTSKGGLLDHRRERLRSHWWSMHGRITEERIREICKAYTNGDVVLVRTAEHGRYVIKFVSILGKPKQVEALNQTLERLLHVGYVWDFVYRYNAWGDWRAKTWRKAMERTWENVRSELIG